MARFFPPDLDLLQPSSGEVRLRELLARALSHEHWIWFKPQLGAQCGGRSPDFLLLGPGYGLVVLQLVDGAPDRVPRRGGRGARPDQQSKAIASAIETWLTAAFPGGDPPPVGWGVVYPGFQRDELEGLSARDVPVRPERTLTHSDLREGMEGALADRLRGLAGAPFPLALEDELRQRMRALIEPQLHFLDLRETPAPIAEPKTGFWLDRKQERMARELASPRNLVYGPAGSGKTVFLVSRAQYWLERNPEARVLFTCYNASLASHLRCLFQTRGLSADGERLTVLHYHDLLSSILELGDMHERTPDYYAALEPRLLQELSRRDDLQTYDLILVDEGQDFGRRMVEVLVRLSADGGEITLVSDPAQDIYERWSEATLAPLGQHDLQHLVDCYRNTAPIFELARLVLTPDIRKAMGLSRLELTRPEDLGRDGPNPQLVNLKGLDDLVGLIVGVARHFEQVGRPLSELALLYPDRRAIPNFPGRLQESGWGAAADPEFLKESDAAPRLSGSVGSLNPGSRPSEASPVEAPHFAEALEEELRSQGVAAEWLARDFASKAAYDITKPRITLSTIHSAKGMDFHTVILLGAEILEPRQGREGRRAEALLFTGITRARENLVVPFFTESGWIPELRSRLEEMDGTRI